MTSSTRHITTALLSLTAAALWACDQSSSTPTAGAPNGAGSETPSVSSGLPAGLVVDVGTIGAEPASVKATRDGATAGSHVTLVGKIGGSKKPFVEGRAAFTIIDLSLKSCDETMDDGCAKPWDYCCEDKTNLRNHSAMIEIHGADGKPLPLGAQGQDGLEPLKVIVVEGEVVATDPNGACIIKAERIAFR
ncbi:MAG: hypothetical protein O2855_06645 [Planctomycetota bacterium]|nr:hypothetical protein [Planctomycetota bacterium]